MGNSLNSQAILELKEEKTLEIRIMWSHAPFWVLPRREKARQQELTAKLGCDATRIDFKQRLCRVDQFVSVTYLMTSFSLQKGAQRVEAILSTLNRAIFNMGRIFWQNGCALIQSTAI